MANRFFTAHSKKVALLLSIALLLTSVLGGTLAYIVTGTTSLINRFISGLAPTGDLTIRKVVTHPFGEDYVVPDDISFTFRVDLGAAYAGQTIETSQGNLTADENGAVVLTVTPTAPANVLDIDVDTQVTVTELTPGPGFAVVGEEAQSVTIVRGTSELAFTNHYTPGKVEPVDLTVTGIKTLEGRDWQLGDSFTFLLEYKKAGEQDWLEVGTATVTYEMIEVQDPEFPDDPTKTILIEKPDYDKFDFNELVQNLSFDTLGIYAFRVSEVEGTVGGVTYDKVVSYFDVHVADLDMDGKLEIQKVEAFQNAEASVDENGVRNVHVTVSNTYAPEGSTTAKIAITKRVTSYSGVEQSPEGFTFELYDEEGNLVTTSEATSAAGEATIELTFEAKDAGKTFYYVLKETNAGQTVDGMTYSSQEFKIAVSVVDNMDGTISAKVYEYVELPDDSTDGDDTTTEGGDTTTEGGDSTTEGGDNTTEGGDTTTDGDDNTTDGDDTTTEGGDNTTEGDDTTTEGDDTTTEGDDTTTEGDDTTTEGGDNTTEGDDTSSEDNGTAEAGEQNGESVETPPEDTDAPQEPGTDEASDDQTDAEKPESDIPEDATDTYAVEFVNIYDPRNTAVSFSGTKTLSGRELKDGEFRFHLYQTGADFVVSEDPIETVTNNEEGAISFKSIICSRVGTSYYVITEDNTDPLGGVTYDDARYLITVTVTDVGGALEADLKVADALGQSAEISFRNVYIPSPAGLIFAGTKVLKDGVLKNEMFAFNLYEADEDFVPTGDAIDTAYNNADGEFSFKKLTYNAPGTYYYVITEDASGRIENVTYDDTIYGVTVKVWDNGEGQILAHMTLSVVGGGEIEEIVFTNIYTEPPTEETTKPTEETTEPTTEPTEGTTEPSEETTEPSEETTQPTEGTTESTEETPGGGGGGGGKPDDDTDEPPTGDRSNVWLYVALMVLSLIAAIVLLIIGKGKKKGGRFSKK